MSPGMSPFEVRDYWTSDTRPLPIVVKEALTFVNTLKAGKTLVTNARVDAHTDNIAFLQSWEKQGGKNVQLNDALKERQPSRSMQSFRSSMSLLLPTRPIRRPVSCRISIACFLAKLGEN